MTVYARAKRAKEKKLNKKKVVICISLLIILVAIIYIVISNRLWEIENAPEQEEMIANLPQNNTDDVLGQLVIEKIDVTKNILNISENASLKLSVAKLYGPNVNESGNFCISGHNWNNMLKRLSEMQVGDAFYVINRETKTKVNYQIYNMYTCVPEDLSCLNQNNDGKREVTLITCNPGGLTRLICKAREV